jgi:small subunit ribosomal protein S17
MEQQEKQRRNVKVREGVVVSDKMKKTVVVQVTRQVRHATYGKYLRKNKKYYAHDEKQEAHVGDRVEIAETRPMSKLKRWRVRKILAKAQ